MQWTQLLSLIAGFIVMLVNGSLYVYGALTPYLATYLYYIGNTSITISQLSIIKTMSIIFMNVGMFCNSFKILTFSNRVTSLIAVIGISLSVFSLSFIDNFIGYIIIYGIIFGFFIGYGYMAPLKNCYEHLPNRKGLCSGTCLMGFGIGSFIFTFVLLAIVNNQNLSQDQNDHFPKEVGERVPFAMQILSAVYFVIGLIGVLIMIPPPLDSNDQPLLQNKPEQSTNQMAAYSKQAIKFAHQRKLFYLALILAMTSPFGIFIAFTYKEYGLIFIKDDYYLSILGSIGSISNGVFRLIWGTMMDYFSYRTNKFIMFAIFIISCSTIVWSVHNQASYLITVILTYGFYGGLYAIYPTQTVKMLGKKMGSKLYFYAFLGFSGGAIIQYLTHKFLVQHYGDDGYTICFIIYGALLVIGTMMNCTIDFKLEKEFQKKSILQTKSSQQ